MNFAASGLSDVFSGLGGLYKTKEQRLRVGSELAPISASDVGVAKNSKNMVVASGDHVRFDSIDIFNKAGEAASGGAQVKHFRSVDIRNTDVVSKDALYEDSSHLINYSEGKLSIYEKDSYGRVLGDSLRSFNITEDSRLVRGADNEFQLLQGAEALTNGKLQAVGADEILLHKSGVDVVAGANATVLNLSGQAASFSGGDNVTYLGSYSGASITGGAGTTKYAGYFSGASISAKEGNGVFSGVFEEAKISGWQADEFSGYFSASEINGGDGDNIFNGMFINGSTLMGGEGRDKFNGRYIDAKVDGGAGDDLFGNGSAAKNKIVVQSIDGNFYDGLAADFINSEATGGKGDDKFEGVMYGGTLDMGEGDDEAAGVFYKATVMSGEGDDAISAQYSNASSFDAGEGDNQVRLETSVESSVASGNGENEIKLGADLNASAGEARSGVTWQTSKEYFSRAGAMASGALSANELAADKGEGKIEIYNGAGVNTLVYGANGAVSGTDSGMDSDADSGATSDADSGNREDAAKASSSGGARDGEEAAQYEGGAENYSVSGDPLPASGHVAATVSMGRGQNVAFRGVDLPRIDINPVSAAMRPQDNGKVGRRTRRADGFGGYDWVKSLT